MKYLITAHPINRQLQQKLGIYDSSFIKSTQIGHVMRELIKDGKKNFHGYYDEKEDTIKIHMSEHD